MLVLLALGPRWFVAIQGEPPAAEVEIDQAVTDIRPLADIIDTPKVLSPTWRASTSPGRSNLSGSSS